MDQQLMHDLDTWCTAFLDYAPEDGGSWGNDGDLVYQILLAAAAAAVGRDQFLGDAARDHVHKVFLRSGMEPARAQRESDRAADMFHTVQMYLTTRATAGHHLAHHRALELHPACNAGSDPRFATEPVHLTYATGHEAWVCATHEECHEAGFDERPPTATCPWLHRVDGPALRYPIAGAIEEMWFMFGQLHRDGAPAWTWTEADGTQSLQAWYARGAEDASRRADTRRRPGSAPPEDHDQSTT